MAADIETPIQGRPPSSPAGATAGQGGAGGTPSGPEPPSSMRIIIDLPPEAAREFKQFIQQTGDSPTEFFRKAISLYKLSKEAVQEGKFVGIAQTEDSLETEFVGI